MTRKRPPRHAERRYWIGYCRKSTETEDRQVRSLEDQATFVRAHYDRLPEAEKAGRPLKLLEEARSAYRPGRPVFGQILKMAARGEVWGVIVVHPNRISRNHTDAGTFVQLMVDDQIECVDAAGGKRYTGQDSNDIFMLALEGAMSWKDSKDKGDRILMTMRKCAAEGHYQTLPPAGYRIVYATDGKKSLQVDPVKAPIIRKLFELAGAGGHSLEDLAAEAEGMGLTNRKRQRMHKSILHKLLTNPFFKGQIRFDGVVAKGVHEPLVTEQLWQRVQRVLSGRKPVAGAAEESAPHDPFVLRGLLQCPKCPRRLCAYRAKRRYAYYECKNPRTGCGVCVAQPTLLAQLEEVLGNLDLAPEDLSLLRERLRQAHQGCVSGLARSRGDLVREAEALQQEIARTFAERHDAARLGVADVVEGRLKELTARRDRVRRLLADGDDDGSGWIGRAIRALELIPLLTEAIRFGPPRCRALALKALASNWSVDGEKLVYKLKSPFRQAAEGGGRPLWWATGDEARTLATRVDELYPRRRKIGVYKEARWRIRRAEAANRVSTYYEAN
ncbi:MAG: recombinase family protein [Gemmataceae bacterium]